VYCYIVEFILSGCTSLGFSKDRDRLKERISFGSHI